MGLRITQTTQSGYVLRSQLQGERTAQQDNLAFQRENPENPLFSRGSQEDTLRVGFGEGTVSVPGSAVRTLQRGIREAARVVPSLQELQEEARQKATEQQERLLGTQEQAAPARDLGTIDVPQARAQAAQQAETFINRLDKTARVSQARLEGREPETDQNRVNVVVGDQTFGFVRAVNTPVFDVFV